MAQGESFTLEVWDKGRKVLSHMPVDVNDRMAELSMDLR